jgi:hypothetical protein
LATSPIFAVRHLRVWLLIAHSLSFCFTPMSLAAIDS